MYSLCKENPRFNLIFYIYFRIIHDTDYKKSGAIDNLRRFFFSITRGVSSFNFLFGLFFPSQYYDLTVKTSNKGNTNS